MWLKDRCGWRIVVASTRNAETKFQKPEPGKQRKRLLQTQVGRVGNTKEIFTKESAKLPQYEVRLVKTGCSCWSVGRSLDEGR